MVAQQSATIEKAELEKKVVSPSTSTPRRLSKQQLAGCVTLWLLLLAIGTDVFLRYVRPLRFVHVSNLVFEDANFVLRKVELAMAPGRSTDILMLGSSLVMAAVNGDDFKDAPLTGEKFSTYVEAKGLERRLSEDYGKHLKCTNLGVSGAFLSDDRALFQRYLECKEKPKALFLLLTPRDLIVSEQSSEKSLVARCLDKPTPKDFLGMVEQNLTSTWRMFALRGDYQKLIETVACAALDRQPTLYAAMNKGKKQPKSTIEVDHWVGWERHNTRNFDVTKYKSGLKDFYSSGLIGTSSAGVERQLSALNGVLEECQSQGIEVVLVNMPLSQEFHKITPKPVELRFDQALSEMAAKHHATFVDFYHQNYAENLFSDGLHLNGEGAKKFWDAFVTKLANTKIVAPTNTSGGSR